MLEEHNQHLVKMEGFGSRSGDATDVCRREIEQCQILVGIYGFRYGFVPSDTELSITEMEFDYALRLGKRCLCYVANESLIGVLSSDGKEEKVKMFHDKVKALVQTTFGLNPDKLAVSVYGDVLNIASGDPIGISVAEFRRNWRLEAGNRQNNLEKTHDLLGTETDSSPLYNIFLNFYRQNPWHQSLLDALIELKCDVKFLDLEVAYESLVRQVKEDLLPKLEKRLKALKAASSDNKEVGKFESKLAHLKLILYLTRYDRCFLVLGSVGAGKTHFLLRLLNQVAHEQSVVFPLLLDSSTYSKGRLEEFLVEQVKKWSKQDWYSLQDIDRFFKRQSLKLVLIVDDIHKWIDEVNKFEDELQSVIAEATKYRSILWVITCRDKAYYRLSLPMFWKYYGYMQEGQLTPNNWLVLDHLNEASSVGINIIRYSREDDCDFTSFDLSEETRSRSTTKSFINNPLFAWTLAKMTDIPLSAVVGFNYIEFVEKYWERLRSRLFDILIKEVNAKSLLEVRDIDTAIILLARTLAESGALSQGLAAVRNAMILAGQDDWVSPESAVSEILAVLVQGNIITIEAAKETRDGRAFAVEPETAAKVVTLNNDTFWAYHFSKQLRRELENGEALEKLLHWTVGKVGISALQEDILQFFLLLMDAKTTSPSEKQTAARCWTACVEENLLPSSASWFGGPRAVCPEIQSLVGTLACKYPSSGDSVRELFSYLYFNAEAVQVETLTYPKRMRNLQRVFPHIIGDDRDLSSYLSYVIRRTLTKVHDNDEMVACLHSLWGCHTVGLAEEVGKAAFERLYDNAGEDIDVTLQILMRYAEEAASYAEKEYVTILKKEGDNGGWTRTLLREFVMKEFCNEVARIKGALGYRYLEKKGWYGSVPRKMHRKITAEMVREANIAFGEHYRHNRLVDSKKSHTEVEDFLNLVHELVNSANSQDRCNAFHLIRHTKRTYGQKAVQIGQEFHKLLKFLFLNVRSPLVCRQVEKFYDMFRINLEDFEQLEVQRKRRKEEQDA
jgi:hypothetical protein